MTDPTREEILKIENKKLKEEKEDNWNLYLGETKKHEEYFNKYTALKQAILDAYAKLPETEFWQDLDEIDNAYGIELLQKYNKAVELCTQALAPVMELLKEEDK